MLYCICVSCQCNILGLLHGWVYVPLVCKPHLQTDNSCSCDLPIFYSVTAPFHISCPRLSILGSQVIYFRPQIISLGQRHVIPICPQFILQARFHILCPKLSLLGLRISIKARDLSFKKHITSLKSHVISYKVPGYHCQSLRYLFQDPFISSRSYVISFRPQLIYYGPHFMH